MIFFTLFKVMKMIKRIPPETQKKLLGRGYFPQEGYVLEYLPVPPNCLSVPEVSDGVSVLSSVSKSRGVAEFLISVFFL